MIRIARKPVFPGQGRTWERAGAGMLEEREALPVKNMQWTVTWRNAYLEFWESVLDPFSNVCSIIKLLSALPLKWELQMLSFKALWYLEMKYAIVSFKESFFTWMQSLKLDSTEALQGGIETPNDSNLVFCL